MSRTVIEGLDRPEQSHISKPWAPRRHLIRFYPLPLRLILSNVFSPFEAPAKKRPSSILQDGHLK